MKKLNILLSGIFVLISITVRQPVRVDNQQLDPRSKIQPVSLQYQHNIALTRFVKRKGRGRSGSIPRVSISTPSYPVAIKGKETKLIPYHLEGIASVSGEITSQKDQFFTQYDVPLSDMSEPFPTHISIQPFDTTHWNELVYLPQSVVDKARSLDEYAIVLKSTFEGMTHSGSKFNVQASVLLLLPPALFSKATPASGAVNQPVNPSLQWNSSVGAIDYEYCFDVTDNAECDSEWTGTAWHGTYDINATLQNLPAGTTFYWQVRANNTAGTTYANNGAWWSFTTSCNISLITVSNINDSGSRSLRQAINGICPGGTINFDSSLAGQTITLNSTLWVPKDMTINGSGLTSKIRISGNNNVTVFRVLGFAVSFNNLMITKGNSGNGAGGGIQTRGTLNIANSVISENSGGLGGGIQNLGTLSITNSTFLNNFAIQGGGIANMGPLNITNSTFYSNLAKDGGAILNRSTLGITNSTFSNNAASQGGGGIINDVGTVSTTNSTFSGNTAPNGGAIYNSGTLDVVNTILANSSSGADCYNDNSNGTIGKNLNNLVEINSASPNHCESPAFTGDPMLGSLANHGGPTQTMALLPGSPAINTGNNASCPSTDQRGVIRPKGAGCDIGAYEVLISFVDVPLEHWAWNFIERLYTAGITGGCNVSPLQYCPEATVTRAQMAIFLERGIHGSAYNPPAVGGSTGFGDVQTTYWASAWIKQLATEGITGGCGSGNYCPESAVTRAQMAIFLLRSKYGASYTPPAVGGSTGFSDVDTTYWAGAWIKQLVTEGITAGCGNGNYCPESAVTRAQMAVFLVRTFNLP